MIRIIAVALGASFILASAASAHNPYGSQGGYSSGYQSYSAPRYSAPTYSAPLYSAPSYSAPRYSAPSNRGYRHYGYGSNSGYAPSAYYYPPVTNPYYTRPRNPHTPRGLGPVSDIPTTEGFNIGYSGGPTFGTDQNPVINGVRLNAAPR